MARTRGKTPKVDMRLKDLTTSERLDKFYEKEDPWRVNHRGKQLRNSAVLALLGNKRFASIVDLACGEGTVTEEFLRFSDKVYGVDLSQIAIDRAKAKTKSVIYITGDIKSVDLEAVDPGIDLVVCMDSILFLSVEEKKDFMNKIYNLPAKKVYFLLSVRTVPRSYAGFWPGHDFSTWREVRDIIRPLFTVEELAPVELDFFSERGYGLLINIIRNILGGGFLLFTKMSSDKDGLRLKIMKKIMHNRLFFSIADLFVQQVALLAVRSRL